MSIFPWWKSSLSDRVPLKKIEKKAFNLKLEYKYSILMKSCSKMHKYPKGMNIECDNDKHGQKSGHWINWIDMQTIQTQDKLNM